MSKKDYELIARAIRETHITKGDKQKVVSKLADHFEKDNPSFKRNVFLIACEAWGTAPVTR